MSPRSILVPVLKLDDILSDTYLQELIKGCFKIYLMVMIHNNAYYNCRWRILFIVFCISYHKTEFIIPNDVKKIVIYHFIASDIH